MRSIRGPEIFPTYRCICIGEHLHSRDEPKYPHGHGFIDATKVKEAGKVSDEAITEAVQQVFSFKPADIVKQLNLLRPIYSKTTNYGHFGKIDDLDSITWEKTDKAEALKNLVK